MGIRGDVARRQIRGRFPRVGRAKMFGVGLSRPRLRLIHKSDTLNVSTARRGTVKTNKYRPFSASNLAECVGDS